MNKAGTANATFLGNQIKTTAIAIVCGPQGVILAAVRSVIREDSQAVFPYFT